MASREARIQEIGEDLLHRMAGQKPGIFNKAWWSGQVMEWAMRDPAFKTEMFRFVDVFPVLDSSEEVGRHIREYLLRPGLSVPRVIKVALKGAGLGKFAGRIASGQIAKQLEGMAGNFIAGTDARSALSSLKSLRKQRQAFTVDLLGEATVSEAEAEIYAARYHTLITELAKTTKAWRENTLLDQDDRGPIPRVNVSVKLTAMSSQLDALDFDASVELAAARLLPLFEVARDHGVFLNLDMEHSGLKDLTFAVFRRVMEDSRLADYEHAGVVVQTYLRDAEADLRDLISWAKTIGRRVTIRLVKGAYWDYETVMAAQEGWPSPVWLEKSDSDVCFEACADLLMANHQSVRVAIGSHNARSIAAAIASAEQYQVPIEGYEIQCLYGMAEPIKAACVARGHRVRVYAPIGALIPGMAYLVRRLLENTSNESWLRMGFAEEADEATLLSAPIESERGPILREVLGPRTVVTEPGVFSNEPLRDFTDEALRAAFGRALAQVELDGRYTPIVSGTVCDEGALCTSYDPADGSVVGTVVQADVGLAGKAIAAALAAYPGWRDTSVNQRVEAIFNLAAAMRAERDNLAALMVREVGKPWREADADVCEAIDFCEYYGREMLRLGAPQLMQNLPGELNHLSYHGRGVTAVIAPWNFPLAILCGMASAALVTGNSVILKPAEQSPVIAARFAELAWQAGIPNDVLHFLPGPGETVGAYLVEHPDVATIAFTGSREVGLAIWKTAGMVMPGQRGLKRVICEMGGKNAVIVDSDADLDEAVLGVVRSAFSFAGQKCSACSRVIVLDSAYPAFVERLVAATRSLKVSSPTDPGCRVGPVIDREAQQRLAAAIADGKTRNTCLLDGTVEGPGTFISPTIFGDVAPDDPLAQEEWFGPVLAVLRAPDFDTALAWANGTAYALTGGVFSRSPSRIARTQAEFRVGNLYINRTITGAIVGRQPFGGFAMSGGGTKAGGPDYLLQFLNARVITENTLRRGFAPEV